MNGMQKSSKGLDSLHYLSSFVSVDQKLSVPIYRRYRTLSLVGLMSLITRIVLFVHLTDHRGRIINEKITHNDPVCRVMFAW